jgi:DNA-binding beta-propeller fold protein YncE
MMRTSVLVASSFLLALGGCEPPELDPVEERDGIGVLGYGTHDDGEVHMKSLARSEHGLRTPRDLAFNPEVPGELWVVNRADDSVVTISDTDTDEQTVLKRIDPFAMHFMEEVSSLSFATGNKFATCHESRNTYNNQVDHNDFMGPTLWSADPDVFAKSNPAAVASNGFDLGSHLDMLHDSPLCMGIAWEKDNIYWTFDGLHGVISRYDFQQDHGPGFDDHADGIIQRFVDVDVLRVEDIPSHMVFNPDTGLLYVVDTGNKRVQRFDPSSATVGQQEHTHEGSPFITMLGGEWITLIGDEAGLEAPSGIALHDDVLYVTDNATSTIHAFSLEGVELDHLKVGVELGGLMGLRVTDAGLFAVDAVGNRVIRSKAKD